jgi:hypothetical protein
MLAQRRRRHQRRAIRLADMPGETLHKLDQPVFARRDRLECARALQPLEVGCSSSSSVIAWLRSPSSRLPVHLPSRFPLNRARPVGTMFTIRKLRAPSALFPLRRLGCFDHCKLNLIGKAGQVQGQSVECLPLLWVCS